MVIQKSIIEFYASSTSLLTWLVGNAEVLDAVMLIISSMYRDIFDIIEER